MSASDHPAGGQAAAPLTEERLRSVLKETGAWLQGHFLLTTGLHSPEFFLLARLFEQPPLASAVGEALAEKLIAYRAEAVAGPALGGIILAHEVARALGVRSLFAEKDHDGMRFKRGFRLEPGQRVVVVEDAVTTGQSAARVVAAVQAAGAEPVAVAAVVDRSGGKAPFPVPFVSLLTLTVPNYRPEECPLCAAGVPLQSPKGR